MPQITSVTTQIVEIPQKVTFETARGKTDVSRAINVHIEADGKTGRGEATPVQYVTGETHDSVLRDVTAMAGVLVGEDVSRWRKLFGLVRKALPRSSTACAGLEMALIDLFCLCKGVKMADFFGSALTQVVTDVTIPIVKPDLAHQLAKEAAGTYQSLKIKVGGSSREEDLDRVRQIHLGAPNARLRIDANQGFQPDEAAEFVKKLEGFGVVPEIVEQPVLKEDVQGLKYCREHIGPPVIADETAVDAAAVLNLVRNDAVDGVNIKLMKSGISGALDIIAIARAAGLKLMIGCMLETPVGIGTAAHLAAGTSVFDYLDLDADVLGKPTGMQQSYVREGEVLKV